MSKKIILASGSERRAQLLTEMGYDFSIEIPDVDETMDFSQSIDDNLIRIVELKAAQVLDQQKSPEDTLVIAGDTMVILDEQVLGKPRDEAEAIEMLTALSGKVHQVSTAICILSEENKHTDISTTDVYFRDLSRDEIEYYVKTYKPLDKAGAYGIQEWIGMVGIANIDGDYYAVMGLPTNMVYILLKKIYNISPSN